MSRFADLLQSLGAVRGERQKIEQGLEAARRELQTLRSSAMCKADAATALEQYVDGCRALFDENLLHVLDLHNRAGIESFTAVGGGLPLLRNAHSGATDERLAVAVLAPQIKTAIRESLKAWKCPGTMPLAKRRARCAELEAEITQLTRELAEIEDIADRARGAL